MRHSRLNALAHDQDGLVTRRQALAAGVSPDAIRHYVRAGGRWQVVVPGIYATFTGPLAEIHRLRATVLHCGNGAVITGMAACRMVGLKYVPGGTAEVDVLVHRRHHPRDIDFIRVHRTVRLPDAVWWMDMASPGAADDIANARPWWHPGNELAPLAQRWVTPMAPIQRSVIDAARIYSAELSRSERWQQERALRDVRALLSEAVQRRHCTADELRTELEAYACWPEARLVVEVNSWEWHRFGNAPEDTERRHALYAALGWTVLPVSPHRLRHDAAAVRREVVAAYREGLLR